jgi:hypothetical protein
MTIITTGLIFLFQITNYQGFWSNQVNLYNFFSLGQKFKLKFELSRNFEL